MVVFDASVLLLLLSPKARPPKDPATDSPLAYARERLEHLVATLEAQRTRIIVPTPALCELLVRAAAAGPIWLDMLNKSSRFRIADFDQRAAVEAAAMLGAGDKRGGSTSPWQKVKFDRQIVAIARVEGAAAIYTEDGDIKRFAKQVDIPALGVLDLPLPQHITQPLLPLDDPEQGGQT